MSRTHEVLEFAHLLLAGAGRVDGWKPALAFATTLFDSFAAQFLHTRIVDGAPQCVFEASVGLPEPGEELLQLLYELHPTDPRDPLNTDQPWHPGIPESTPPELLEGWRDGSPITCRMFVDDESLHASEIYRRVLRPAGNEYTLVTRWFRNDGTATTFAVMRGPDKAPYAEAERALLASFAPFIRDAADVHWRLLSLDFERRAALQALDGLVAGIAFVDGEAHVSNANDTFRELVELADGIDMHETRLTFRDPGANRALHAYLHADRRLQARAEAIAIERPSGLPAYIATVSPLAGATLDASPIAADKKLAILLVVDPLRGMGDATALLQLLFGLTPTESRVVLLLLEGHALKTVAARMDISINTVKMHVKELFRKTCTHRQAELVALVSRTIGPFV